MHLERSPCATNSDEVTEVTQEKPDTTRVEQPHEKQEPQNNKQREHPPHRKPPDEAPCNERGAPKPLLNLRGGLCHNERETNGHNERGAHPLKLEIITPTTARDETSDIAHREGHLHSKKR